MPITLNGRVWTVADFAPWKFAKNWEAFWTDAVAELAVFQGGILRDQAAASAASAATSARAAEQAAALAGTGTATGLVYAAVAKSLASATDVVAVHIYDTRLDSDGGAWATRVGFPALSALTVRTGTTNRLTIHNLHSLDANGVPVVWRTVAASAGGVLDGTPTGVFALNGRVWVTGSAGLHSLNFAANTAWRRDATDLRVWSGTLMQSGAYGAPQPSGALVAASCIAVHARVLPGAPLDSAGLQIPSVAVATAAGASIIHPWGAVYDITYAGGYRAIQLGADGRLETSAADAARIDFGAIPYADVAHTAWRTGSMVPTAAPALLAPTSTSRMALSGARAAGCADGLTLRAPDAADPSRGMSAFVSTSFATGWMPGDIRGAWLCDAATGSVTAATVLSETFASAAAWTLSVGSHDAANAELDFSGASGNVTLTAGLTGLVVGQTYLCEVDVNVLAAGTVNVQTPAGTTVGATTAAGVLTCQFTAAAVSQSFRLVLVGATGSISAVTVRAALPDRSYKGKGLVVNGTLNRTALPCGLAYVSGFAATAYLEQSYNVDLDFGTGDFCLAVWVLLGPGEAGGAVFSRADDSNPSVLLSVTSTLLFRTRLDGAAEFNISGATDIRGTGWRRITAIRRGTTQELWLDGVLLAQASVTAVNLSESTARSRWGQRVDTSQPFSGGCLCMARAAAGAPTPAQIRRIYEEERALIVGGTPATLGGASAVVTSLAANEGTGTLAVGTGDGVSVFSGLGRVAYYDGASGGAAIGNDAIVSVSASGPHLLIGTSAGAGLLSDSVIARDRLAPAGPARTMLAQDRQVMDAWGVTTDATPTDLSPRISIGEREAVTLDVTVQARTYGASSTQGGTYRRFARYIRDAGGNVTLAGSIQVIGTDQETTAGMDVTFSADTAAQTVTPRVTGVAATRMVWTARIVITRISEDQSYAA